MSDRIVDPVTLDALLTGVSGPTTTRELVAHARNKGGDPNTVAAIEALPDRRWRDVMEAVAAINSGFEPRDSIAG